MKLGYYLAEKQLIIPARYFIRVKSDSPIHLTPPINR